MKRGFSIVTVSKGRLEHLKQTLPAMLAQGAAEVIVVDYSCPQRTGDYVAKQFPAVHVVRVDGESGFSNWKGRNAGAATARSEVILFCDADIKLAGGAVDWLDRHLPPRSFGYFDHDANTAFNRKGPRLADNQLKGFHVIPAETFRAAGGYDELFEGYAAGGDTDLAERLLLIGQAKFELDPAIIEDVIQHSTAERLEHHREPVRVSYGAGLIYLTTKLALLKIRRVVELPLELRRKLYDSARALASELGDSHDQVSLTVDVNDEKVWMPRQLGYEEARTRVSLRVEIEGRKKLGKKLL